MSSGLIAHNIDPWYEDNLVCPIDHLPLRYSEGKLISTQGREYPVVDGVPVLLVNEVKQTIPLASLSLARAKGENNVVDQRAPHLYLESLGISDKEKEGILKLANQKDLKVDPVVSFLIGATCGNSYSHLIGNLNDYPIPKIRLPQGNGELFLDVGCSWGRWCISAARKGYTVIGIDPSLGAIMSARRIAREMGLTIRYVVGDARYLPFKKSIFDKVFSYSVLQHLSKEDVNKTLLSIARVLKPDGISLIQMPNSSGIRNLQQRVKKLFRNAEEFGVTYWNILELKRTFRNLIGKTEIEVDCFFGLGLQKSDIEFMTPKIRWLINLSEFLRAMSKKLKPLVYLADSVYVKSIKQT